VIEKIHAVIISLGCSKNLVDAECMTSILLDEKVQIVSEPSDADVIIVNTCGFIESAKKEAIETILTMAEYKKSGSCRFLVVTGCLAQRYKEDIQKDMPEVDAVLGTGSYQDIGRTVLQLFGLTKEEEKAPSALGHIRSDRIISTKGFAWLKIAEGCSHGCAFCAIPMIRGKYRSRPMEDILEEARILSEKGYREIILIAQDTTSYGMDLYKERRLPELLRELSNISGISLLRIMYTYSDGITDELVQEMATNSKVAKYLDMPIQHGDDGILRAMRRRDTKQMIRDSVLRLRAAIPNIVLRTTVLLGFPGETEEAFQSLLQLISELEFDRLGAFSFSSEEGTLAAKMENQLPEEIKERRVEELMLLQQGISLQKNRGKIGEVLEVSIESTSEDGVFYIGRSYGEAPEIDPSILVVAPKEPLEIGQVVSVRIVDASEYELIGETL